MIKVLRPASREEWLAGRKATIGASELAALFGCHDYLTPFELFAIKSGVYTKDFAEAEITSDAIHIPPTERGNLFEDDAFELLARLRPEWKIETNAIPGGLVFVDQAARMSSTPDAFAIEPGRPGRAAIQTKTMNDMVFREKWLVDGVVQPPLAVAVQAIDNATLSNCDRVYAAAMVVGFQTSLYLVEVPLHAKLMARARDLVADFCRRVEVDEPSPPDFARDGSIIASIYSDADGGEIDLSDSNRLVDILAERERLKAREKDGGDAEKERKTIDAELIFMLGNASRELLADGRIIEAPTTRRKAYEVKASSYRVVRIK